MNLVFIGMSGSGKSVFAKYCAELLDMSLTDTDEEIEKNFGDINGLFSSGNEPFFRACEEKELLEAAEKSNFCISTGGGAVLNETAMRALKKSGLVVYLKCNAETLYKRLCDKNAAVRPLLNGENAGGNLSENIENMLSVRAELYELYADIIICEDEVLKSRGIFEEELSVQLGALYIELVHALEKKVDDDRRKYART